jgi:hypothetical protein
MSAPEPQTSWWQSLPGILTGTAALVTAVVGLGALVNEFGWIGTDAPTDKVESAIAATAADNRSDDAVSPPPPAAAKDAMATIIGQDGSKLEVRIDSLAHIATNDMVHLLSGQRVMLDRVRRIDVTDILDASNSVGLSFTLLDGSKVDGRAESGIWINGMKGTNALGPVELRFREIKSIIIPR